MDVILSYIMSDTSNVGSKQWMKLSKGMSFRALVRVLGLSTMQLGVKHMHAYIYLKVCGNERDYHPFVEGMEQKEPLFKFSLLFILLLPFQRWKMN